MERDESFLAKLLKKLSNVKEAGFKANISISSLKK